MIRPKNDGPVLVWREEENRWVIGNFDMEAERWLLHIVTPLWLAKGEAVEWQHLPPPPGQKPALCQYRIRRLEVRHGVGVVADAISTLLDKEQRIVRECCLSDGVGLYPLTEIAGSLGTTVASVAQTRDNAIKKLVRVLESDNVWHFLTQTRDEYDKRFKVGM